MIDEIISHEKLDNAVGKDDEYDKHHKKVRTTKGWRLGVQWRDDSTSWVSLKEMKNGYPIETAQYAIRNQLQDEPAFSWWVPYVERKRDRIINKLKSKYWERTHKYGIRIPKSVKEAYSIDNENGDTMWADAVREEMKKIKGAVRVYDGNPNELVGYQEITGRVIFDVKLGEGFRREARFVEDGHKTETPSSVTYS